MGKKFWNVIDGEIDSDIINIRNRQVRNDFLYYQKYPKVIVRQFLIVVCIILVAVPIAFFTLARVPQDAFEIVGGLIVAIFMILLYVAGYIITHAISTKKEAFNILLAEKNGWIFDKYLYFENQTTLENHFPFLARGESRYISNQFFGQTIIENKRVNFWAAKLEFSVGTGKMKTYKNATLFAFQIPKKIENPFHIFEEFDLSVLRKKDFEVESVDFNNTFAIRYSKGKKEAESEIVRILTPGIQQELLDCAKKYGQFGVGFFEDAVLFTTESHALANFFPHPFTDFEIDPAAEKLLNKQMSELFIVAGKIFKFVD